MLEHGGQIHAAALRYGIPVAEWLDLSTGINPIPFVPPAIPLATWQRLPQEQDGLLQAAASYYGSHDLLPVAGTQAAIQLLPRLRTQCRVGVLTPAYAEHAHAWRNEGHDVIELNPSQIEAALEQLGVLVLIHPNNPTGALFNHTQLYNWYAKLNARQGWLIVDEAFIEASSQTSTIRRNMPYGLIVLRSQGKFFGLAGARVGFVFAQNELLSRLRTLSGPWSVSGPARYVALAALRDKEWQTTTGTRLQQDGARLGQMLQDAKLPPDGGCALFQWVKTVQAQAIHQKLAQRGILTRLFTQPHGLRFGLPGTAAEWSRLQTALTEINK